VVHLPIVPRFVSRDYLTRSFNPIDELQLNFEKRWFHVRAAGIAAWAPA